MPDANGATQSLQAGHKTSRRKPMCRQQPSVEDYRPAVQESSVTC